ncbi:amino acid adenylation domain-containing protein [Viridibacillus sp. NPDC096237]|uniref:non-ribosomal peptide synthetase n=1 Tax=Viridibacillus sp. NPDC096237 TaxID=3390721 RepID=UPI003D05D69B
MNRLTKQQEQVLQMEKYTGGSAANLTTSSFNEGDVSDQQLFEAIKQLYVENDSLRLRLVENDGEVYQVILPVEEIKLSTEVLVFDSSQDMEEYAQELAYNKIPNEQLVQILPIRAGANTYGIIVQIHHAAGDGWTVGNIWKRFVALVLNRNHEKTVSNPENQFREHIEKEYEYYDSERARKDIEYWKNTFTDFSEGTFLIDKESTSFVSKRFAIDTTEEQMKKINAFSKRTGYSVFCIYLGALAVYLGRIKDQEKFCIGTALLNRRKAEEKTMGMFVNTVGLNIPVPQEDTFASVLENTQKMLFGSIRRMKVDFTKVLEELRAQKNQFKGALYDVYLSYQNVAVDNEDEAGKIKWYHCGVQPESLSININDWIGSGTLKFEYDYHVDKFTEESILTMHDQIVELLLSGINDSEQKLKELPLCDEKQKQKILTEFNHPMEKTAFFSVVELFKERVKENPDAVALEYEQHRITYQELDLASTAVAEQLNELGAASTYVALHVKSGYKQIIAILATLKAGAAYVPLDITIPDDRKAFILNEIDAKIVLCDETVFSIERDIERVDISNKSDVNFSDETFQMTKVKEGDPAYILFTSGTTGTPKGVVVSHGNLSHYAQVCKSYFGLNPTTKVLQQATYAFDIFVEEVFPTLLAGGTVVLFLREEAMSFEALTKSIIDAEITMISCTPLMVKELAQQNALEHVEIIISGGDVLKPEYVTSLLQQGKRVYNTYGPTEGTVCATYHAVRADETEKASFPIGKPIPNVQVYILIEDILAGIGVTGEICIGGLGVATGYFKNKKLTEEKFIDNPFGEGKLYRSGDMGYYTAEGEIVYSGRIDNQVKIRGYRIEISEIEEVLKTFSAIEDVFIRLVKNNRGDNVLWAYLIDSEAIDIAAVKVYIRKKLPEYMVPSQFLQVDQFPLNLNGKIDTSSLPELTFESLEYEAPTTETEQILAGLIEEALEVERVGRNDDFFNLGGHSLKAMQLATRINQAFGVELSLRQLFKAPVIRELATVIDQSEVHNDSGINKIEKTGNYLASPAQRRLFLVQQIQDSSSKVYNMPAGLAFEGKIDVARLQKAFVALGMRHDVLRTTFHTEEVEVMQRVADYCDLKVEVIPASKDDLQIELEKFIRPFDLENGPLIRLGIQQRTENTYYFFFDMHHIISDGLSLSILFQELEQLYQEILVEELPIQYADYSAWMNQQDDDVTKEYWMKYLEGFEERLAFPLDFPRPKIQEYKGKKEKYVFTEEFNKSIYRVSKELETTPYVVFASAFFILLHKYTMQKDITMGTGYAGRSQKGTEKLIGLFVNTVVLRADVDKEQKYSDFLQELKTMTTTMFDYQHYPFEQLLGDLGVNSDSSRHPMFDVMYTYQNEDDLSFSLDGAKLLEEAYDETIAKFDLQFEVIESNERFSLEILYNTGLFLPETIVYLFEQCTTLLTAISENVNQSIAKLNTVSEKERSQILDEFNQWQASTELPSSLKELFKSEVDKSPDKIALVTNGEYFTYGQLLEKTKRLAATLQEYDVQKGDKVAIVADKSLETILSILATVYLEAVYVPVDPAAPMERQRLILNDVGAHVKIEKGEVFATSVKKEQPILHEDPIAYIMYTSGTTGRPRGVVIRQSSIVHLVEKPTFTTIDEDTVILQTGSMAFDAATFEIWGAFLHGAKLVLVTKEEMMDIHILDSIIQRESVNFMFITTAFFNFLIDQQIGLFAPIKQLYVGGEKASPLHMKRLLEENRNIQLSNIYGPTENTTYSTAIPITLDSFRISIGYPLGDTAAYIMQGKELVGVGMVGEICLAGDGIAEGYYKMPELTKEKFVPNPFGGGLMYHSGDLGRFLPDGSIEYIGRLDDQVKIRGYRIELLEIQIAATRLTGVKEAFVQVVENENDEKSIVAYIISDVPYTLDSFNLDLAEYLPSYMLPHHMHQLEQLPLNQNGKVDTKALPSIVAEERDVVPPETEMEEILIDIYEEVLQVKPIGRYDDFFALGGHSLKAMQVANRVKEQLNIHIGLRDLFAHLQVASLAAYLESQVSKELPSIEKVSLQSFYPLSSAQKRLYLIQTMQSSATIAYNMPLYLAYEGEIDLARLEAAFAKLVKKHEILRTNFVIVDGLPMQKVQEPQKMKFNVRQGQKSIKEALEDFVKPFDLEKDSLVRLELYENQDGKYLLFDMHHIISDGFSVTVLIDEISRLYNGEEVVTPILQYKDYSEWIENYNFKETKAFWEKEILDMPEIFDLPHDNPRGMEQQYEGSSIKRVLGAECSQLIDTFSAKHHLTPYMVFATAFMILLAKKSGQSNIRIGVPVAGRIHKETESMLGLFVNTILLQNEFKNEDTILSLLDTIKQKTLLADVHQAYPFDRLIEELQIETDSSRNPLFDVMFSFQNNAPMEFAIEGITVGEAKTIESVTKFDLNLDVLREGDAYVLDFMYRTDLFHEDTIETLSKHMEVILNRLIADTSLTVGDMTPITEEEKEQILHEFNQSDHTIDFHQFTIAERFRQIAKKFGRKEAVNDKEGSITYQELEQRVAGLAQRLRDQGAQKGDLVAVFAEQNIATIVSILAILELEMAYLLIDVDLPEERKQYLFEDGDVQFYLKENESTYVIEIENISCGKRKVKHIDGLAYIMYTSGTTGLPKGVQITQKNILSFIFGGRFVPFDEHIRMLHTSAMSFDATTFEIFATMLFGGTLTLVPTADIVDAKSLANLIEERQSNCIFLTTALFNFLIDDTPTIFSSLAYLLVGGEKASIKHMRKAKEMAPNTAIYNMYGPTETTTFATAYELPETFDTLPIGSSIMGKDIYVLDGMQLCGIGIPGEICIGGLGVSEGYLNEPELTQEKFILNPFGEGMLYRSGDLGYFKKDGNVIYMDRVDEQVKIRGFRIELNEIEAVLKTIEHIKSAVVVVHQLNTGDKLLWGYVVADKHLDLEAVKQELRSKVPNYMMPTQMMQLDTIPLNKNGKTDRRALPEIQKVKKIQGAAQTDNETILMEVLKNIVGQTSLSRTDDFFEIGGDSIKAMRLIPAIRDRGYGLSIEDIIKYRQLDLIAKQMKGSQSRIWSQEDYTGEIPLSALQKEWVDWKFPNNDFFNQGLMLHADEVLDEHAIKQTLEVLITVHDNLRLRFAVGNQSAVISNCDDIASFYVFETIDISEVDATEKADFIAQKNEDIQRKIRLGTGPLVVGVLYRNQGKSELFLGIHHMIIDGVSWRILLEEFVHIYPAAKQGIAYELPKKTAGYAEWVAHQEEYVQTEKADLERDYWKQVADRTTLTWSEEVLSETTWLMESQDITLSPELTGQLLKDVHRLYNTEMNDVLVSGVVAGFANTFHKENVVVELEGHGRQTIDKSLDLDKSVGWFTSMYPVLITRHHQIEHFIRGVKSKLRNVPNSGAMYLPLRHSKNAIPAIEGDVLFNYLGDFDSESFGSFVQSEYDTGIQNDPHNIMLKPFMVNASVRNGMLHFNIIYNCALIDKSQVDIFSSELLSYFEALTEHVKNHNKLDNLEWVQRKTFKDVDFVQVIQSYDKAIQTEEVVQTETATFAQNIFLKQTKYKGLPICACVVQIEESVSKVKILETLNRLIATQPALRQVVDKSGNNIVTYSKEFEWPIPYFVLGTKENGTLLESKMQNISQYSQLFEAPGLMVKHVVFMNEDGTHTIYIYAHHAVWDLSSLNAWQSEFEKLLKEDTYAVVLTEEKAATEVENDYYPLSKAQEKFLEIAKGYIKKLRTRKFLHPLSSSVNDFRTYDLAEVDQKVSEKPLTTALELMKATVYTNLKYENAKIPFFILSHGRSADNQNQIGLFIQLQAFIYEGKAEAQDHLTEKIQAIWTGENTEEHNFEVLAQRAGMNDKTMIKMLKKLPIINVSTLLDAKFTDAFEEQTENTEAFGETIGSIQLQLRKEVVKVVATTYKNTETQVAEEIEKVLLKNQ